MRTRGKAMTRKLGHRAVTLVATGLVALACDSSRIAAPHALNQLARAEALWHARSFADYRYEIRTLCFCPPEITTWVRVTVAGGVVVAAEQVDPNPLPVTILSYWQPIDSVFARLRRTITDPGSRESYESITAEYDVTLGYPVQVDYRAKPFIADGGSSHELRNVLPYPDPPIGSTGSGQK